MLRRALLFLNYNVSPLSRVAIFPIHLDPPTVQHREIFKLLLGLEEGMPATISHIPAPAPAPASTVASPDDDTVDSAASHYRCSDNYDEHASTVVTPGSLVPQQFSYMEPFAESLSTDSQLAPFDDIILIPNSRYPLSLRHSTHLAALAVLAKRDLPGVHVDFRALEHPDPAMPVVYDLTQCYRNGVIVHWLHDAYDMQRWHNFAEMKFEVPILLLQTSSLPPEALTQPQPPGAASTLHSREYASRKTMSISNAKLYGRTPPSRRRAARLSSSAGGETPRHPSQDVDELRREPWWVIPGGRGDDLVEASRSYSTSITSSWLGAPTLMADAAASDDGKLDPVLHAASSVANAESDEVQVANDGTLTIPDSKEDTAEADDMDGDEEEGGSITALLRRPPYVTMTVPEVAAAGREGTAAGGGQGHSTAEGKRQPPSSRARENTSASAVEPAAVTPTAAAADVASSTSPAPETHGKDGEGRNVERVYEHKVHASAQRSTRRTVRQLIEELFFSTNTAMLRRSERERPPLFLDDLNGDDDVDDAAQAASSRETPARRGEEEEEEEDAKQPATSVKPSAEVRAARRALAEEKLKEFVPLVEVHPVTRCTGADVRQALWERELSPEKLLTGCVLRYVQTHGLYQDVRKSARSGFDVGSMRTRSSAAVSGSAAAGVMTSSGYGGQFADDGLLSSAPKPVASTKANAELSLPGLVPRLELHYDKYNLLAREQYEKLKVFQQVDGEQPDLIVPIGGDGYMMHCIRKNWRRFIPFYGVNAGHVGYLLNSCSTLEELFSSPLKLHTTTMLYCEAEQETDTGERKIISELAFNDVWMERASGQTALIRIIVNGEERIRRLRGDGVLVSTAAGSTAYSQALGASPVPVGTPLIQVVGSNVVSPAQWRPAHLNQEDQVEFEVIDKVKRPCNCYVDSVHVGNVTRMLIRSSRVACVSLAFSQSCDLQQKLYQMQFPTTR